GIQRQEADQVPALPVVHNLPVLIVDDNATNLQILEEWLRDWHMEPTAIGDGVAAMAALWHAVAVGLPYGLIPLDARMPVTHGLALAARIREWPELSSTRIIMLTSGERPLDAPRALDLRIDAYVPKPVQQEELLDTIQRVMSRSDGEPPPVRTARM